MDTLIPAMVIMGASALVKALVDLCKSTGYVPGQALPFIALLLGPAILLLGLLASGAAISPQAAAQVVWNGLWVGLGAIGMTQLQKFATEQARKGGG